VSTPAGELSVEALRALVVEARAAGDPARLAAAIPYATFLGLGFEPDGDGLLGRMAYAEHLIGDASIPALHGGTLAALLESTATLDVLWRAPEVVLPRTVTLTIDYLRTGRPAETRCRASVVRQGKRIVVVSVRAFQDDEARPIATAVVHLLVAGGAA
jgi:uncharacterized protein (TIGR00369 family)